MTGVQTCALPISAALREQTAAWEENAKAQAYQESLKEIYSAQAQAELERQKNVILLADAQADLNELEEKRTGILRHMQALEKEPGKYGSDEYIQLERRLLDLSTDYD